jgi:hypothetical protein
MTSTAVMPAKAGIHVALAQETEMDARFRGHDGNGELRHGMQKRFQCRPTIFFPMQQKRKLAAQIQEWRF